MRPMSSEPTSEGDNKVTVWVCSRVCVHSILFQPTFQPFGTLKLTITGLPKPFTNSAWKLSPPPESGLEKPPPHCTC